jgi:hypothetical protein
MRQNRHIRIFFNHHRSWTVEEKKLLGTAPDAVIAQRLKRTQLAVESARRLEGIPSPPRPPKWTRAEDKLLERYSDEETARRLNRTRASVQCRRFRLGIPVKRRQKPA